MSGDGQILLIGLGADDRERLVDGLRASGQTPDLLEVSALADALVVLAADADPEPQCVVAGSGAATGGWEAAAEELRRVAPNAALIAVTAVPSPGAAWHDVVRPTERDPLLLARVFRCGLAVSSAHHRLARWAMRDPLTDLMNRRGLERVVVREASDRERGQGPLAALLLDCDDFKRINDDFGLATGDDVLRQVAAALLTSVRSRDTVARVGGDEFLVLLPHTRTWEAVEVAERIRKHVREMVRLPDNTSMSVSIGVRRLDHRVSNLRDVVEATQEGLKQSKIAGKDQVRVVDDGGKSSAAVAGLTSGMNPETTLPPGTRMFAFTTTVVRDLTTGAPIFRLAMPDLNDAASMALSTHRATLSAWDLMWFSRSLQVREHSDLPIHARIFPSTLLEVTLEAMSRVTSDELPLARVTLAIDDQYLTGDPSVLAARIQPLRARGVRLCVDASDLGRACLESLILLRPERVNIDGALVRGFGPSRVRQAALRRFVLVCEALGAETFAGGIDLEADRLALLEIGVRRGYGAAVPTN